MQRPHDDLYLSPDEGGAADRAPRRQHPACGDRRVLVQVVRWLLWLSFVVQEAKRSLTRLRTILFGTGAETAQAHAPEASSPARTPGGEGAGAGEWWARRFAFFYG